MKSLKGIILWNSLFNPKGTIVLSLSFFPKFREALLKKYGSTEKRLIYGILSEDFPFLIKALPNYGFFIENGSLIFIEGGTHNKPVKRIKLFLEALAKEGYDRCGISL